MAHCSVAALGAVFLVGSPSPAADRPPVPAVVPIVRVLDVSGVDKKKQQVLFVQTVAVPETIEVGGKTITRIRNVTAAATFTVGAGNAMTAAGKLLAADEVLKRLEKGGSVALIRNLGQPLEGEEDPGLKYRKLFKDDTIFLIGELEAVK